MDYQTFFSTIADIGEPQLMSIVAKMAIDGDIQGMNGLVDFLDETSHYLQSFRESIEFECLLALDADDSRILETENFDFPKVFVTAISTASTHNSNNSNNYNGSHIENGQPPLSADQLALFSRAVDLFSKPVSDRIDSDEEAFFTRERLLFCAASKITDERAFKLMFDSGAVGSGLMHTSVAKYELGNSANGVLDRFVPALEEATYHRNFQGAAAIIEHGSTEAALKLFTKWTNQDFIAQQEKGDIDYLDAIDNTPETALLAEQNLTYGIINALASENYSGVENFLNALESKIADEVSANKFRVDMSSVRAMTLSTYLAKCMRDEIPWNNAGLHAILGGQEKAAAIISSKAHAELKECIDDDVSFWTSTSGAFEKGARHPAYFCVSAQLAYQAIRSHCTPVLDSMGVILSHDKENAPSFDVATNYLDNKQLGKAAITHFMRSAPNPNIEETPRESRFSCAIEALLSAGHDINKKYREFDGLTPLHMTSFASKDAIKVMLPIMLSNGADPSALNLKKQKPIEMLSPGKLDEWEKIERSFSARSAAMSVIELLNHQAKSPSI